MEVERGPDFTPVPYLNTQEVLTCGRCGGLVVDYVTHTVWHNEDKK